MTPSTWKPSPALAIKVTQALNTLARHFPRAMSLASDTSEAGHEYMADYARAMMGADLEAIPEAAQRWLAENSMPPRPADLAKLARDITRERRPIQYGAIDQHPTYEPALSSMKDAGRTDTLSRRAYEQLGRDWKLVGEVWALLMATAPHPDHREAARTGRVPFDVFDDAVERVKAGVRAPAGPLAAAVA